MSPEVTRWLIAVLLLAHGIGHVLFMPLLAPALRLDATGQSWLLDPIVGGAASKLVASVVGALALAAFVAAAGGVLLQAGWWRPLAITAAIGSACLVVALWGGIQGSSAFFALAFDAVVLVALIVVRWPSEGLAA